jgi:ribosomal protein L13
VSANRQTVEKKWVVIDASNQILGRLSSQIVNILRGKNKPSFTPHVDCGDNVIVINAEKIRLTGKKMTDKVYTRHTGHPGGQRFATPRELMAKDGRKVVEMLNERMPVGKYKYVTDLHKLENGMYLLYLRTEYSNDVTKIIVNK